MTNVAFRVDSSARIGSGHLMRCLTLAEEMQARGSSVVFICRDLAGNLTDLVQRKGFKVIRLKAPPASLGANGPGQDYEEWLGVPWSQDADETRQVLAAGAPVDWLIIDHYALGQGWEQRLRSQVQRILVIDDLANRSHDCDCLLDQNLCRNMGERYHDRVPRNCRQLLGPQYALLRKEFGAARESLRERPESVNNVLLFFGGADPTNETEKALDALDLVNQASFSTAVVVGQSNPNQQRIQSRCSQRPRTQSHVQTANMADLMTQADLALGASGSSTWERCCLGLPSLTVSIADNQVPIAEEADRAGLLVNMGRASEVTAQGIADHFISLMGDSARRRAMGRRGLDLVDGRGGQRVAMTLLKTPVEGTCG